MSSSVIWSLVVISNATCSHVILSSHVTCQLVSANLLKTVWIYIVMLHCCVMSDKRNQSVGWLMVFRVLCFLLLLPLSSAIAGGLAVPEQIMLKQK